MPAWSNISWPHWIGREREPNEPFSVIGVRPAARISGTRSRDEIDEVVERVAGADDWRAPSPPAGGRSSDRRHAPCRRARFSCGTRIGFGTLALVFLARLKASTIGRKVGAGIAEEIVDAVVGERAQESIGGNRLPFASARCHGHGFRPGGSARADAVFCFGPVFYATGTGLTTDAVAAEPPASGMSASPRGTALFRRQRQARPAVDLGQAFGEAFAFRVDQGGGAGAGDGVGRARRRDVAGERRADHARFDGAVIGKPARVSVAIALDQPRAFGDFEREIARERRGLGDQLEPGFDLRLFLLGSGCRAAAASAAWPASGNANSR